MSEQNEGSLVDDSITADDAGFASTVDMPIMEEASSASNVEAKAVPASTAELKETIEEAIEEGASEKEIKEMIKEYEIKVNGKKEKVTIDLSDDEAVTKELQLARAARPAMQRAKELEKLFEQEINRLKSDPASVLKELGMNPEEWAENLLRAKVEELKKSPEQVEKEKMQKELEEARSKLKAKEEEASKARFEQLQSQQAQKIEQEISDALDAHKTLPKTPRTVRKIADAMLWAIDNGYDDVSVQDVLPSVEEEIRTDLNSFMEDLPEELLEKYVSKKAMEKMRKRRVSQQAKPNVLSSIKPTAESVQANKEVESKKKQLAKNYFRNLK